MTLQKARLQFKKRLEKAFGGEIFLADWEDNRVAWEGSPLVGLQYSNIDAYLEAFEKALEGTGYWMESNNSCEGNLYKI